MADFSIDELDATQAGSVTADTIKHIANDARNAACGFFNSYPSVVIPNPAFGFLSSLWDGFCKNSTPGLPPAPSDVPFSGGQCSGVYYRVAVKAVNRFNPSVNFSFFEFTHGPVRGLSKELVAGSAVRYNHFLDGYDAAGNPEHQNIGSDGGSETIPDNFDYSILYINRNDGAPDTCGDPPPVYPPPTTQPIPTTPGGSTYNLPNIAPTFNNSQTFNVTPTLDLSFPFSPVIQVGGINVSLGGGGASVGLPGGGSPNPGSADIYNLLGNISKNLGDGTLGGGGVGAAAAGANKNTAPTPKPGSPGTNPPVPQPPTTKTNKNISNLSAVEIILTTLPTTRNEIFGDDAEFNVYIAGWFTWLQGSLALGRFPIQFENNIFFAPKGSDGYSFTITNGGIGHAVESTLTS